MSNYFIFILNDTKEKERECIRMCRAILISEVIINRCIDKGYPLNTSKLQKILYYMQKEHLMKYGEVVFDEPIVAWECGPAIKDVAEYFTEGSLRFKSENKYEERISLLNSHEEVLMMVLSKYGTVSPLEMAKESRKEECWIDAWKNGEGEGNILQLEKKSSEV